MNPYQSLPTDKEPATTTLTLMQRQWLEHYLTHRNATKAARETGYKYPDKAGPRLKKNPKIIAAIEQAIKKQVMERDMVLARLSAQARAEYANFIKITTHEEEEEEKNGRFYITNHIYLDLKSMIEAGKGHLIKSIKIGKFSTNIEFHDAQTALITIGKYYKLWIDRSENTHKHALDSALDQIAQEYNLPL